MQAYRTETTLSQDGKLSIKGLPFRKGEKVEVIILTQKRELQGDRYPLRGMPITYLKPYNSVAEDEWEALE